jgi:hypothetical protein
MKIGTKSLLFGVHQFLYHPWTVARAWRFLYGRWPKGWEWVAILVHDWGYWGCETMDGRDGKLHPKQGARIIGKLARKSGRVVELIDLVLYHSRSFAAADKQPPSKLCWPDKASLLFDPPWFYLLRARLSGELVEYRFRAALSRHVAAECSDRQWLEWLKSKAAREALENVGVK